MRLPLLHHLSPHSLSFFQRPTVLKIATDSESPPNLVVEGLAQLPEDTALPSASFDDLRLVLELLGDAERRGLWSRPKLHAGLATKVLAWHCQGLTWGTVASIPTHVSSRTRASVPRDETFFELLKDAYNPAATTHHAWRAIKNAYMSLRGPVRLRADILEAARAATAAVLRSDVPLPSGSTAVATLETYCLRVGTTASRLPAEL